MWNVRANPRQGRKVVSPSRQGPTLMGKGGSLTISEELEPRMARLLASRRKEHAMAKNTICLWYDKDAEAAARFYAETFPDSAVGAVHRAPSDYPVRQGGRRADGRVHRRGHSLPRPQRRARRSSTTRPSRSRSPPTTRRRPTATGTPSSATAARRARAAGARTSGASPGRSRRAC